MSEFLTEVLKEIDDFIASESACGVFDLPVQIPNIDDGSVTPIWTTHDEEHGAVFILKIESVAKEKNFIQIFYGDGGVIISRSEPEKYFKDLMFNSTEKWSEL